jgi:hypothetical protein
MNGLSRGMVYRRYLSLLSMLIRKTFPSNDDLEYNIHEMMYSLQVFILVHAL